MDIKRVSEVFPEHIGKWLACALFFGAPALLIFRLIVWLLGMPGLLRFQWVVLIIVTILAHHDIHYWDAIGRLSPREKKKLGIDIDED